MTARVIAISPKHQQTALQTAIKNIRSIDQMGILCLTVTAESEQMWNEYAQSGTGFVISFDTTHEGFRKMTAPMSIHKVTYSGEGFPTFLGMVETNPFEPLYRKRLNYSYEQEWRSLRLLKDLEPHPNDVFLASLDPRSILEIVIRSDCV
jgi:hypothetical protein